MPTITEASSLLMGRWRDIYDYMRSRHESGQNTTFRNIADEFGISTSQVSFVMDGLAELGLVERPFGEHVRLVGARGYIDDDTEVQQSDRLYRRRRKYIRQSP